MDVSKEDRKKFGVTGQPIKAEKVYRRKMNFDHDNVEAQSWVLISGNQRVHANTYNGNAGRRFDPTKSTHDLPEDEALDKLLEGYEEVSISDCPIAEKA